MDSGSLFRVGDLGGRRPNGALETEILSVLQSAREALSPGEVRDRLCDRFAYSTVVTVLSRLHTKGVLIRARQGRAFVYAPVDDEPGLAARRMHEMLRGEHDREAVLTRFVSAMSGDDEQLLRRLLGPDLEQGS